MTTRDDLTDLIAETRNLGYDEIADAILKRFLVVPLSDIQGTEYGWRHPMAADGPCDHKPLSEHDARRLAGKWGEAIHRPILPWTPIHEGGEA